MNGEVPVTWPLWIAGVLVAAGMVAQWMQAASAPGKWAFLLLAVLVIVSVVAIREKKPRQPQ
jgi:hypothetical protein